MTTGNLKRLRPYDAPPQSSTSLVPGSENGAVMGYLAFAALWFVTATGIATLAVLQMVMSSFTFVIQLPLGMTFELNPDTVAAGFRHAFVWGWLTNAAFGAIFFITSRITGRPIAHSRVGFAGMMLWNVGFAAGLALLYIPQVADVGTLTGFPLIVNLVLVLALVLISVSFWPSLRGSDAPYVALAWFAIGMLSLLGMTVEATIVGFLDLDPALDAVAEAMWVRGIAIVWLLGIPIGAIHYLVPRLTGQPLASGALAWFGLAAWFTLGVVSCFGAAVSPLLPYALVSLGNAATILLLLPATAIIGNLAMTLRGRWAMALSPGPMALAVASLVFLGGTVLLAGIGSLREVQTAVAYTAWPGGVAAFGLLGASTIGLIAVGEHAWPRLLHRAHAGGLWAYVVTWAAYGGAFVAGAGLIAAGLFHVGMVADGMTPAEIQSALLPIHLIAFAGLGLSGLAAAAHAASAYVLAAHGRPVLTATPGSAPAAASTGH
jgi:cytochrome c oxidase cbb3-type subunit 1